MTLHWTIKMLNAVFVISMGMTVLWLFICAFASDQTAEKVTHDIEPFFLDIKRNNAPYLKVPLDKNRYLIGRDAACDIGLKGIGIPAIAAEVCIRDGHYIFCDLINSNEFTGDILPTGKEKMMKTDMVLANYILRIEAL